MKYKSTKYGRWILCLLTVAWCGIARADPSTFEKLQSMGWDSDWRDVGYDLVLMGDDAVPFLTEILTNESQAAQQRDLYSGYVRGRTISLLRQYCPDVRALPILTTVFLHDTKQHLRQNAAETIAEIDPEYARQLMGKYLEADAGTQDIAFSVLEGLGDKRAASMWVSVLVSRLENPETRRGAALRLAQLKDKRAVPVLLEMLNDQKLYNYNRREVAFALAGLQDKRAVPFLLDMLDANSHSTFDLDRALETLAQLGDERAIPVLLNFLADSNFGQDVAYVLPQFGPAIVPPLLELWEQANSQEIQDRIRDRIADVLADIHHLELAPIYGQTYFEAEDYRLRNAMLYALRNMGGLGFEHLLKAAKQKPDDRVWQCLSTYNSKEAIDFVTGFALDRSSPHRLIAIETLGSFGKFWQAEIAEHIPLLLADADPSVKINTIRLIQKLEMVELWKVEIFNQVSQLLSSTDSLVKFRAIRLIKHLKMIGLKPALQTLTQSTDEQIRNAAHNVLAVLSETEPLKLDIEMSRPRYDYDQSIDLTYRITNVSSHPITISTVGMHLPDHFLRLEIQLPDGTFEEGYRGVRVSFGGPRREDYQTLKPGDELTVTVSVSKFYWLHQAGRYTIQLHFYPFGNGRGYGFMAWTRPLTSSKVHFDIEPPTAEQLNTMLALIDAKSDPEATRVDPTICHQLGELRHSEAIPALKQLVLVSSDVDRDLREFALSALAKFSSHELTPMWIEMLNDGGYVYRCALQAFLKSKDPRAIEPLRRIVFRADSNAIDAALTLQKLGDDTGVEWFKEVAWRKLRHRNKETREDGTRILRQLQPRSKERRLMPYQHPDPHQPPDPQRVLTDAWFSAMINDRQVALNWLAAGAKQVTITDAEELLKNSDLTIQRAAVYALARLGNAAEIHLIQGLLKHSDLAVQRVVAYELAHVGNASGIHLIEPDLYADDAGTRQKARSALLSARSE